jgi:hypothetical protein
MSRFYARSSRKKTVPFASLLLQPRQQQEAMARDTRYFIPASDLGFVFQAKRKGVSAEEKYNRLVSLFYESVGMPCKFSN